MREVEEEQLKAPVEHRTKIEEEYAVQEVYQQLVVHVDEEVAAAAAT